ncbi:MAG: PAS domain S-box protein [Deltaproteobacteria bacterium]|nr:PAS domain S-box protein [Deltaproteobacteria bacterium]
MNNCLVKYQSFIIPLLFIVGMAIVPLSVCANYDRQNVLVLQSYHKGYLWTDDIVDGINRTLSNSSLSVNVQYEYMDSKKILDDIYIRQLVELYRYKFRNRHFDAIISADDDAFNFLRDYRDQLFPGTPVIFCGTNYMTPERKAELPNSTGVNEAASLKGNVELILSLYPKAAPLVVITDDTTTGMRIRQKIDEFKWEFKNRTRIVILHDLTMEDLADKLYKLPDTAVVLYTVFAKDSEGKFFEYDESINKVISASSRPVFVTWDFSMGTGAVGGLLTSGISQGETAGRIALQVLKGKRAESIPFIKDSPNKYIFDYNALQRFGMDFSILPPQSIVRNQPHKLYKKYKVLIIESLSGGVILILIIVLLTTNSLRRRRAEELLNRANEELEEKVRLRTQELASINDKLTELNKELSGSEERYHSLSDASFEGILLTKNGIVIEANDAFCTMLNCHPLELIDKKVIDLVPEDDRENIESKMLSGYSEPYEIHFLRKGGSMFPAEVHAKMFMYKGQQVRVASIRDLTETKKAEEEIQALKGIIPICMHCKGIRDDKGYWNNLEKYISEHSEAMFSHSVCEKCLAKYYPDEEE